MGDTIDVAHSIMKMCVCKMCWIMFLYFCFISKWLYSWLHCGLCTSTVIHAVWSRSFLPISSFHHLKVLLVQYASCLRLTWSIWTIKLIITSPIHTCMHTISQVTFFLCVLCVVNIRVMICHLMFNFCWHLRSRCLIWGVNKLPRPCSHLCLPPFLCSLLCLPLSPSPCLSFTRAALQYK